RCRLPTRRVSPRRSVVQDDAEERAVDLQRDVAVVVDETELLELVQEEIDARTGGADHLGERLLRHLRHEAYGLVDLAVARQQQQRAGQTLFARVEQL